MKLTVGVIGAGKLGSALCDALSNKKLLKWILARSKQSQQALQQFLNSNADIISSLDEISIIPDLIILAVSDSAINQVAVAISKKFKTLLSNKIIAHCSGVITKEALSSCEQYAAKTASIHPYQTFYYPSKNNFKGIMWGIETDEKEKKFFSRFVKLLGGKPYFFTQENIKLKALYHSSAVAASNFLTTTIEFSRLIADEAFLPLVDFLPPIIKTTINNNLHSLLTGDSGAMTGPIARGDLKTIKLHIDSLSKYHFLKKIYINFALTTTELAYHNRKIKKKDYNEIKSYLIEQITETLT
jgi:predicted short-subunit dehydrogenase-like oxidoreductase (DUF2520 family)